MNKRLSAVFILLLIILIGVSGCDVLEDDDINFYTLTVVIEGDGSVFIDDEEQTDSEVDYEIEEDSFVELRAEANQGSRFIRWEGRVSDERDESTSINIDQDRTVIARFDEDPDDNGSDDFAGGDGSRERPYQVANAEQLDLIREYPDKYFKQVENIDLREYLQSNSWQPIGDESFSFNGNYDGDNREISGLRIVEGAFDTKYVGLFGFIENGKIENVRLTNVNIDVERGENIGALIGSGNNVIIDDILITENSEVIGMDNTGGLAGLLEESKVTSSSFTGNVTGRSGENIGGLVGQNINSEIYESYSNINVSGKEIVGGLVGLNIGSDSKIRESYATSGYGAQDRIVTAGVDQVGGLAGSNRDGAMIRNSYAIINVEGRDRVGGLVGFNSNSEVRTSYAVSKLTGRNNVGGVIGRNSGELVDSFYDKEVSGLEDHRDSDKGIAKTTLEMIQEETFSTWGNNWRYEEEVKYPYLWWQLENTRHNVPVDSPVDPPLDPDDIYSGGDGSEDDPYLVENREQLDYIRKFPDFHYQQISDIDLSNNHWQPIEKAFTGSYDGRDHEITNLRIDYNRLNNDEEIELEGYGLFSILGERAKISNLNLINVDILGRGNTGGFVGKADSDSRLENLSISGFITGRINTGSIVGQSNGDIIQIHLDDPEVEGLSDNTGGLAGIHAFGEIKNVKGSVKASGSGNFTGGLAGYNERGKIIFSSLNVEVEGARNHVGGLIGHNSGEILESDVTGNINGEYNNIAGLVGRSIRGNVSNSWFDGIVNGDNNVAGLIGLNERSVIYNSFTDGEINGYERVGGLVGSNGEDNGFSGGTIVGSYSLADIFASGDQIGGLLGYNNASIYYSYAKGNVITEGAKTGGFIGKNTDGEIIQSYFKGDVSSDAGYAGGFIGFNTGIVENSYTRGVLYSEGNFTGGFIGFNDEKASITKSYSSVEVSFGGDDNVGGFIGNNNNYGELIDNFFDLDVTGYVDGTGEVHGYSTEEMMQEDSFESWDFDEIWAIEEGDSYPYFKWESNSQILNSVEIDSLI